jgi:hypothetical protein
VKKVVEEETLQKSSQTDNYQQHLNPDKPSQMLENIGYFLSPCANFPTRTSNPAILDSIPSGNV